MLNQATHWMEVLGTAVDAMLLCRVLLLRLHRAYLFITLGCVLAVFFDIITLWLRADTEASFRIFLYSRFLYAIVFPLMAWDVFEEIKSQIGKLRRFAASRMISALFFAIIFGLVMGAFVDGNEAAPEPPVVITLGLVLWAGAATAALAFLITVHRVLKAQPLGLPNNTRVWLLFFELSFGAEALDCFLFALVPLARTNWVNDVVELVFVMFTMGITGWCILKLRPLSTDLSAPENARLG